MAAEYVVFSAIRILSELLLYDAKNTPELRGRVELIQMKLRQLQSMLEIADSRQESDDGIANWIAETREVAYDIEDLLLVAMKDGSMNRRRYANYLFKEGSTNLHHQIQLIEAKVSALESDLRVRNIKPRRKGAPNPVSGRRMAMRRSYSHRPEEDFVGLDDDVEELVVKLVEEQGGARYQALSITGMGGIGKTTLAQRVYHHPHVRRHFHAFAWACVSQQGQAEEVLQRILSKVEPEKKKQINKMNTTELVEELFRVEKMKRCLIVLDDIWDMDVWDTMKIIFHNNQRNNMKVIITTRNKEIARYIDMDVSSFLYEQRHLNQIESWELLRKKVHRCLRLPGISDDRSEVGSGSVEEDEYSSGFEEENNNALSRAQSFHSCFSDEEDDEPIHSPTSGNSSQEDERNQMDMEKLGREMVAQCGGLPLAIIVLGGLLMTKSTLGEWRTVHQNFSSYLRKGRSYGDNGRIHEVLALSYHDLPYQLKPCFLHLANFPEDSKIPTRKLYQLWASEGFISQESGDDESSIMDIAQRFLAELVQRCMVQVRVDESNGRFKSCRLHDLTRELCLVKIKEENFLRRIPLRYEVMSSPLLKTRRLSIAVDSDFDTYFPPKKDKFEHVRSTLFFSRLSERRNLDLALEFVCNEMKLTRVLDLERFDFGEKLCKSIGNLVYLKYMSLRGSQVYKLPSSIGNLKCLQTFDLRVPFLVCLTIPNVLCKLTNLKHLYLPPTHKSSNGKLQLHTLTKLEIIKNFDTRVSDYRDVTKLTSLHKVGATLSLEIENLEAMINCFRAEHKHMKDSSFRLRYDFQSDRDFSVLRQLVGLLHVHKLDLIGSINKLPKDCHFSPSITKLTLRMSRLKEDPMPTLEKLPRLHTLILRKNAFEGNAICCSSRGFPSLAILELQGLTSLEYWRIDEGAMPVLYSLKIDECANLRMVPEGIKFIASLRELVIVNMPDEFKMDVGKVGHVTSITIAETSNSYMKKLETQHSGNSYSGLFQSFSPSLVPKDWQKS